MAAKKTTGTGVALLDQRMADLAAKYTNRVRASDGLPSISLQGGTMTVGDRPIKGGIINCIILSVVQVKKYFPSEEYDPDNIESPVCYAKSADSTEIMAPHDAAPEKQCTSCEECPFNAFGTSTRGRGKRCKDEYHIAVITEDSFDDLDTAVIYRIKIPPTSMKKITAYMNSLLNVHKKPPFGVVTELSVQPNKDTVFTVDVSIAENNKKPYFITDVDQFESILSRVEEADKELLAAEPKIVKQENPAKGKGKKPATSHQTPDTSHQTPAQKGRSADAAKPSMRAPSKKR